jgi:AcrR family transcriptional regulator
MPERKSHRTHRTGQALRDALAALLRRKNYDDITVQDIVEAAKVGRSTFYLHCTGKEDLLRRGLQALRSELVDGQDRVRSGTEGRRPFSLKLLEHVEAHRDLYPALGRGRGRDVLMREIGQVALALSRDDLNALDYDESLPRELTEQFIVGAFMSVLTWWLERKPRQSPAAINAVFERLMLGGITARHR